MWLLTGIVGYTGFYLQGEWANEQIRKLLIGSISGTVEALTNALSNCVDGPQGWGKFCNIANNIRVSSSPLPRAD